MVMATNDVYSKGSLFGSDKDWYHGQLTAVKAEKLLTASGSDCFLIREDKGALVLSLLHHGEVLHLNIDYGPGWYELEGGSAQYSFTELEELVSRYSIEHINEDLGITLGVACQKINRADTPHLYEAIAEVDSDYDEIDTDAEAITEKEIYSTTESADLMKYDWYHGNITKQQAEIATNKFGNTNKFLVRGTSKILILSKRIRGWPSHDVIHRGPGGYHLKGRKKVFKNVPQMIAHYQKCPIENDQVLGKAAEKYSHPSDEVKVQSGAARSTFKENARHLKICWERCADIPVANALPPVVKMGNFVYVGYGLRKPGDRESDKIFKYDITRNTWSLHSVCPTANHGLAALNGELLVIGGLRWRVATNLVYTFREGDWQQVLPPMPTPRCNLSATSHGNRLVIAAGGTLNISRSGRQQHMDVIEIYRNGDCWYSTKRLPFAVAQFSMHSSGSTCYVLGGVTDTYDLSSTTLYANVSSLLENAVPVDNEYSTPCITTPWEKLRDRHPLTFPSLVELDGRLLAMGGSVDEERRVGSKFISAYDFATSTWVECKGAELPLPLYRPGLLNLGNNKVMLIGGQSKSQQFSSAVFIGSYKFTQSI